ncbi:hypothetical protein DM02DRAFT_657422 [Periconia macrospinosa]|uniref:Uncharacterized protein n=1 Tax=Periconia macrospinosa TaxID=97972 RepID=A0A2V1DMA4_9PLEO|nr:hypothetical protein DM02DRAFT_657422 [Periconia macrospinosa]
MQSQQSRQPRAHTPPVHLHPSIRDRILVHIRIPRRRGQWQRIDSQNAAAHVWRLDVHVDLDLDLDRPVLVLVIILVLIIIITTTTTTITTTTAISSSSSGAAAAATTTMHPSQLTGEASEDFAATGAECSSSSVAAQCALLSQRRREVQ